MTSIEDIKHNMRDEIGCYRQAIDGNKVKILRIEQDIARDEGMVEGILLVIDSLKSDVVKP